MKTTWVGAIIASGFFGASHVRGQEELEEITVVGSRVGKPWIDAPGSVLTKTSDDLVKEGSQDLAGFAKYDPTVSLPFDFTSGDGAYAYGQSGYGSINIRGIEGNRVAMELDGIRQAPQYVSTSFDMGADDGAGGIGRDYFDPSMFQMIEVLKGGASALYGSDAMGGVVSFTTPDPEHFLQGNNGGGLLRTQYFSVNDSFAAQAGGAVRSGNTAFMLLGAYRSGGETENNGNIPPNPATFDSHSLLLKAEHRAGLHFFRLAVEKFERDSFIDAKSAADSDFVLFNDFVHNTQLLERERVSGWWEFEPENGWLDQLKTHLYWQRSSSNSSSDSAAKPLTIGGIPIPGTAITRQQTIEFETEIFGLTSVARKEFSHGNFTHQVLAGIDLSLENSENRFDRVNSGTPVDRIAFAPSETERAGIFFQDEIRVREQWFVTPGLRVDWTGIKPDPNGAYLDRLDELGSYGYAPPEDYDNVAVSPRINVSWKPKDNVQWYASYAHGIRNPTAEELSMIFDHPDTSGGTTGSMTVPNPDLEEETSNAFEIGVKAEGGPGRFQAAAYYTRYSNFIENGVNTGLTDDGTPTGKEILTTENVGKAEIYGFEVGGSLDLGHYSQDMDGWLIGLSTGKSVGINRNDETWLNSVEPWKTIAFVGYDDPGGKFGARLTGIYTDDVTRVDDTTTTKGTLYRPPSWFTLDLGVWWKPQETLTIHAGLNNIFDEKYWNWGSVRRGNGHLGGNSVTERSTAPGRNFSITLTKTF